MLRDIVKLTIFILIVLATLPENLLALKPGSWDESLYISRPVEITALGIYQGQLVAAGGIPYGEGEEPIPLGWWDGSSWTSLTKRLSGTVSAILEYKGNLIVGGHKVRVGSRSNQGAVLVSNGEVTSLGRGLRGSVSALAIYGDDLIAGGSFSIAGQKDKQHLAQWDGEQWHALGLPLSGGGKTAVHALIVQDNILYAGGVFSHAGSTVVHNIAAWNGTQWSSLGTGANDAVNTLTFFAGDLIAGGKFNKMDGAGHNLIARWNGDKWLDLSGGCPTYPPSKKYEIQALCVHDNKLVVGGNFFHPDETLSSYLILWTGTSWQALSPGLVSSWGSKKSHLKKSHLQVSSLLDYKGGLVVGSDGLFTQNGELGTVGIWKDNSWSSPGRGSGMIGKISKMVECQGEAYALHECEKSGSCISRWNGNGWDRLSRETDRVGMTLERVLSVTSNGDELIIFGYFKSQGKRKNNYYARYDHGWKPLGETWIRRSGVVSQMEFFQQNLIAFEIDSGAVDKSRLRSWDGTAWQTVHDSGFIKSVDKMVADGEQLYLDARVSSHASRINPEGRHIVIWDGETWSNILEYKAKQHLRIHTHKGELYAGFSGIAPEDSTRESVMRWDGTSWNPVGGRLFSGGRHEDSSSPSGTVKLYSGRIRSLLTYKDTLVVSGVFLNAGKKPCPSLAWFDGQQWRPWQSGGPDGTALLAQDDRMWIGGRIVRSVGYQKNGLWNGGIPLDVKPSRSDSLQWARAGIFRSIQNVSVYPALAIAGMDELLKATQDSYINLERLGETWSMLSRKFKRDAKLVNNKKDYQKMVESFVSRFGDPHFRYIKRKNRQNSSAKTPNKYIANQIKNFSGSSGWIGDDICYLTLNDPEFFPDPATLGTELVSANGILIDLRRQSNSGRCGPGKKVELHKLVSTFGNQTIAYGLAKSRNNKTGTGFSVPDTLFFSGASKHSDNPSRMTDINKRRSTGDRRHQKRRHSNLKQPRVKRRTLPVVCLIDGTVSGRMTELALMISALPNGTLVGESTRGAVFSWREIKLIECGTVHLPTRLIFTLEGLDISGGPGIDPDIFASQEPRSRFSSGPGDAIFEKGLELLQFFMVTQEQK